ncbi:MAG: DEAD/DEAH box helicase [Planctomyces sp.]|jgi:superfamily II DNA or RNA helicase
MSQQGRPQFPVGSWVFSSMHSETARVLEAETCWNHTVYQVWLPRLGTVERIPAERLLPVQSAAAAGIDSLVYAAAAARIADALTQDVLLAPLEAGVIPLPHQLYALNRAVTADRVRFLLADEVGLGKTIEAGLIFRELKLRGLVKRVLIVAPKGLVTQWVQELQVHFNEEFRLISPGDFSPLQSVTDRGNVWRQYDQVVCTADSIKPIDRRRGWSAEKLESHNQARLGDLIDAGWDLIICDEAHRMGGSTEQVARYRLGRALADAAPALLLLSATPHQGKTAGFQRLMALLDQEEFISTASIRRDKVAPFVIRTEKRRAINDRGEPLFMPRMTRRVPVRWEVHHVLQQQLYEAVTGYVRLGYNQAVQQNRQYLGFLMILMQRLVTSSTLAIATALERRLETLQADQARPAAAAVGDEESDGGLEDLDGQEQLEELLAARLAGLRNEQEEVRLLLELARRCQSQGPDARAETLLNLLYTSQQEENNPQLKYLIFTEFVPTQRMLAEFLEQQGFSVVCLNGSMDLAERKRVQQQFAAEVRVLVSTDAGGEGLNLQFAHIIINYDLPWNPMRIEQRIGRVDRIGQKFPVKAFNLIFEDSVELRVQEVLEQKLETILEEFGVNKTQDVLDSAASGALFERLYAEAILDPESAAERIEQLVREVREQAQRGADGRSYYDSTELDPQLARQLGGHPLPFWVERMVTAWLRSEGGRVRKDLFGYELEWPDGSRMERVCFHSRQAEERGLQYVNLEDSRVRRLVRQLPRHGERSAILRVRLPGLPAEVAGYWSIWRIATAENSAERGFRDAGILPMFVHDDGRNLIPTARHLWDALLEERPEVELLGELGGLESEQAYRRLRLEAERLGTGVFQGLCQRLQQRLSQERDKGRNAFRVRREALERLGLPEVRQHRLKRLREEERAWAAELQQREQILPDLQPVVVLRVEAGDG